MFRAALVTLVLVGLAASGRADYLDETPDRAQVLAVKSIKESLLTIGENLTVTINLFNVGGSAAHDISIADAGWSTDNFQLIDGKKAAKVDKLGVGANYTHTFVLIPKSAGSLLPLPATVTYRPKSDSEESKTVISSDPAPAFVMSKYDKLKVNALKAGSMVTMGTINTQSEWQTFATFTAVVTILIVGNQMILKGKAWHKQRLHNLAYESLKKEYTKEQ